MKTFISIDWDFCFYRALEAEDVNRREKDVPLWPLFDWGHTEAWNPELQTLMWQARFAQFRGAGLDPYAVTGHPKAYGCTAPEELRIALYERFDMSALWHVTFSDSHRHCYYEVLEAYQNDGKPIEVVNFDAHHDLGYDLKALTARRAGGLYGCDDWLLAALSAGLISKLTTVYPDWRGMREWQETPEGVQELLKPFDLSFTTFSKWLEAPGPRREVENVHIARSGAWVPPWFDAEFNAFVHAFTPEHEYACTECVYAVQGSHGCEPRVWVDP